ncbi:hypothetical protein K2173_022440 [Erythroxylum novogranatense]|uniref:SANT domain-containing protein n=1 Tax=Erythroxylum novogranatense TaxID=1862640 RepID=A0AAV8TIY4_9ROSI|nr:hypothetical protein K2173_022440 [Erythroxylum novogranatense]
MDLVDINHSESFTDDDSGDQPSSEGAPGVSDASHDPELLPRIGEQYQVEIPPLLTKSAYILLTENPNDAMFSNPKCEFLVGLPLSLMWISYEVDIVKDGQKFPVLLTNVSVQNKFIQPESSRETKTFADGALRLKGELIDEALDGVVKVDPSGVLHLQQGFKAEMLPECEGKSFYMVPGSFGDTWTDTEEAGFLLGLYIFGKNLVQVKKFLETKSMGGLLSFYYGKFYGSDRYNRWSECRKMRNRRCIYGQRIFTGLRQQELLSRLLQNLSEEYKTTLLELVHSFGEGRVQFEEYVFAVKAKVGLRALIEAVAIGKGKKDLTSIAMEPIKSNQVSGGRPEIPIGKACSKLTPLEITDFLTGGYRLSKARSNDLFWEAVWPRLLARGWHSEQPNDHGFAGVSRNCLVFLIPGIKKFSRRKLVKGTHFFDSVSDVLNKVAADPALLDLDEVEGYSNKEEKGCSSETNIDQGDVPHQQRHCYLKPRTPSQNKDAMKFTIVDTKLRRFPDEILNISTSSTDSEESGGDSSKGRVSDESDPPSFDSNKSKLSRFMKINVDKTDKQDLKRNASEKSVVVALRAPNEQKCDKWNRKEQVNATKRHVTRRIKHGDGLQIAPGTNPRKRLTAYKKSETKSSTIDTVVSSKSKQDEAGCSIGRHDVKEISTLHENLSQEKLSTNRHSSTGSPNIGDECSSNCNTSGVEIAQEKPQNRVLIDLNVPIVQDTETEPLTMEMAKNLTDQIGEQRQTDDVNAVETSKFVIADQQHNMNSRRQSIRNRPPTAKALEAVACGFLGVKQKRRSRDEFPLDSSISRPSKRVRSRARITEKSSSGVEDLKEGGRENGAWKG